MGNGERGTVLLLSKIDSLSDSIDADTFPARDIPLGHLEDPEPKLV